MSMKKRLRLLVPLGVLAGLGYMTFVFAKVLCVDEVLHRRHKKASAVVMLTLYAIILTTLLGHWIKTVINGPGVLTKKIAPYKLVTFYNKDGKEIPQNQSSWTSEAVPDYFFCDSNGYPYYCPTCQLIKPLRARHLNDLNRCVAKMDHLCVWIGAVIGKKNYANFIYFTSTFFLILFYVFVCVLCFIPGQIHRRQEEDGQPIGESSFLSESVKNGKIHVSRFLNPNLGVTLALTFFWMLIILGLVGEHIWYISRNETTIEHIQYKRAKRQKGETTTYINIRYNSERFIVEVSLKDTPFRKDTFLSNFKEIFPPFTLFRRLKCTEDDAENSPSTVGGENAEKFGGASPVMSGKTSVDHQEEDWLLQEVFGENFLHLIYERLENGEGVIFPTQVIVE